MAKHKISDEKTTKLRDDIERYIKFMKDRPVHLIDISNLIEILKEAGIKIK